MYDRLYLGSKNFNLDYQDRRDLWIPMFVKDNTDLIEWCSNNLINWLWEERIVWDWINDSRFSFRVEFFTIVRRDEDRVAWSLRPDFD
jgi:hypothetical protein